MHVNNSAADSAMTQHESNNNDDKELHPKTRVQSAHKKLGSKHKRDEEKGCNSIPLYARIDEKINLKQRVLRARRAIRKKLALLQKREADAKNVLNKVMKPVSQPLQKLVQETQQLKRGNVNKKMNEHS